MGVRMDLAAVVYGITPNAGWPAGAASELWVCAPSRSNIHRKGRDQKDVDGVAGQRIGNAGVYHELRNLDEGDIRDDEGGRNFLSRSANVMVTLLSDTAASMTGCRMKTELDENKDFQPDHVTTAHSISIHHEASASDLCQELVQAGMMVHCPESTEWCAPAHFVPKLNGKVWREVVLATLSFMLKGANLVPLGHALDRITVLVPPELGKASG
eukprot:TCALIF_13490-PA protein Name:"Protein of unknown function" AED:0.44 eAED:0.46 QI:0/0/0/0.33/1/1/3/0/212